MGLRFIAGAAAFPEAGLQLLLFGLELAALLLVGLVLLLPLAALGDQSVYGLGEPLFFAAEGLQLAADPLRGQSPLPAGGEQVVPFLPGLGQGGIGGFEFLLDIIGKSKERAKKAAVDPEPLCSEVSELLAGLEASGLLEMIPLDAKPEKADGDEQEDDPEHPLGDEPPTLTIGELASKTMVLQSDSAQPKNVQTYAKTDWSCHKRIHLWWRG